MIVDNSHSKMAKKSSNILSPLVIALDDILHLERVKQSGLELNRKIQICYWMQTLSVSWSDNYRDYK